MFDVRTLRKHYVPADRYTTIVRGEVIWAQLVCGREVIFVAIGLKNP